MSEQKYASWNPWHGCTKYSEGCRYCYVYRQDEAYGSSVSSEECRRTQNFNLPVKKKRDGTLKIAPGSIVMTCFTSDFLLKDADEWRDECWQMIKCRNDCMFYFFTKRIERFPECVPADWGDGYDNVIVGCTCENQDRADFRLPIFAELPIRHKTIILGPMLGPVNLEKYLNGSICEVACSGESGINVRPLDYEWVLDVRRQCMNKGVPFQFHQTGAYFIKNGRMYRIPRRFQISQARKAGIDYKIADGFIPDIQDPSCKALGKKDMDRFADQRDFSLLEHDRYTFFVLRRIIGGSYHTLLSNHENLIICYTGEPYPVWIWTADGAPTEIMEKAYRLALENGFVNNGQRFNMKYDLAEYMIYRAAGDGKELSVSTNMFAYDCPEPVTPSVKADGEIYRCTAEDLDELAEFLDAFHQETGIDRKDAAGYRADARAFIDSGNMFLWKNAQGISVASCKYAPSGMMASINLVFTRKAYRRKHYAENLVYQVSMIVKEAGFTPMLYTDADYTASNACYEKIGYILRGRLCTVTVKVNEG